MPKVRSIPNSEVSREGCSQHENDMFDFDSFTLSEGIFNNPGLLFGFEAPS